MMKRDIFVENKGKQVTITLKPNNFVLNGKIVEVFDDCILFRTYQKDSYLDFDIIGSLKVEGDF